MKIQPTSQESTGPFFRRATEHVEKQKEQERKQRRELFDRIGPRSYCQQHGGTTTATPERSSDGTVQFDAAPHRDRATDIVDTYGIYPQNEVFIDILSLGSGETSATIETNPVEATVRDISGTSVTVELHEDRASETDLTAIQRAVNYHTTDFAIAPLLNPIPFDRREEAIRTVGQHESKRNPLTGRAPVSFGTDTVTDGLDGLNDSQREAAEFCASAEDIGLIHGPPGTGKTRTIVALVDNLVQSGNRVLVCAHSNQATDNIVMGSSTMLNIDEHSLHKLATEDRISVSRTGTGVRDAIAAQMYGNKSPDSADVVAATTSAASQFSLNEFDVAIIDEATQASIPSSLIPYKNAQRTILVGDHKQLPPYSSTEFEERDIEISLFEHLIERYGDDVSKMLTRQYRMNDAIAAFPSQEFYDGTLETAERNQSWTVESLAPLAAFHVEHTETQTDDKSYKNEAEADIVAEQVRNLVSLGVSAEDIGIITAYSGQVQPVRDRIAGLDMNLSELKIDTVDSFQGSEREAMIVSFVRSNEAGRSGFLSFPDEGRRRLNVALTRAKKRLVLIGNWTTLAHAESGRDDCADTYVRLFKSLHSDGVLQKSTPITT